MKKKNLIILLLIPFIISLLGVVTINSTFNLIENDIMAIKWDYKDIEAFKIIDGGYKLEAVGLNPKNAEIGEGNDLVWSLENKNSDDDTIYAEIINSTQGYYLKALLPGEVIITCSNQKGNVFRKMTGIIYADSVIIVQPKIASSQNNIDDDIYYGLYDLDGDIKVKAEIDLDVTIIPESMKSQVQVKYSTENLKVDLEEEKVYILDTGEAKFTIGSIIDEIVTPITYEFIVVDGVNCYTYSDLLNCTNFSKDGEVIVLRKNFESQDNYITMASSNVTLFGNYDEGQKSFTFSDEIYKFSTTYNKNYIDQWNATIKKNNGTDYIDDNIKVGLHVQKDVYGNGYTINMHNLTYPTAKLSYVQNDGTTIEVPELASTDLFRGPLPFYALGNPNNMPLVMAYGQDNIGMYVDGDNITINDINLKNCDFGSMLSNLEYTGTVLEVNGDNVTIENSRLQNGKNVLRAFSSQNLIINNSLLSNSRNFLIETGSNEYMKVNDDKLVTYQDASGNTVSYTIKEFLTEKGVGDDLLNSYLMGSLTGLEQDELEAIQNALQAMQEALNDKTIEGVFKGSMTINDTFFYRSGISSIAINSMFNGPFLYSSVPSQIKTLLSMFEQGGVSFGDFGFENLSGMSYPVSVEISGKTKFYDYKKISELDITGLIRENMSTILHDLVASSGIEMNIDTIFPIKSFLEAEARKIGCVYEDSYINIPIAYYGGGLNLSTVIYNNLENSEELGQDIEIDLFDRYSTLQGYRAIGLRAVTIVTGYDPFKFVCLKNNGYLFNESPNVSDLIKNAKGGK